ncbi:hypothetical protein ACVWXN_000516 [Bradyrhizobium sp. i1.4.4]
MAKADTPEVASCFANKCTAARRQSLPGEGLLACGRQPGCACCPLGPADRRRPVSARSRRGRGDRGHHHQAPPHRNPSQLGEAPQGNPGRARFRRREHLPLQTGLEADRCHKPALQSAGDVRPAIKERSMAGSPAWHVLKQNHSTSRHRPDRTLTELERIFLPAHNAEAVQQWAVPRRNCQTRTAAAMAASG